jgi:membrane protein implicated in regulation of membrane protease activity
MLACIASRFNYGLAFVDDVDFKVQFASFSFLIVLLYLYKRRRLQPEVTDTMLILYIVQINGEKPKR